MGINYAGTRADFDNTQHEASPHTFTHTPIAGKSRPGSVLVDQGTNAIASILSNNDNPGKEQFIYHPKSSTSFVIQHTSIFS
jgi:hypothetical protein